PHPGPGRSSANQIWKSLCAPVSRSVETAQALERLARPFGVIREIAAHAEELSSDGARIKRRGQEQGEIAIGLIRVAVEAPGIDHREAGGDACEGLVELVAGEGGFADDLEGTTAVARVELGMSWVNSPRKFVGQGTCHHELHGGPRCVSCAGRTIAPGGGMSKELATLFRMAG